MGTWLLLLNTDKITNPALLDLSTLLDLSLGRLSTWVAFLDLDDLYFTGTNVTLSC